RSKPVSATAVGAEPLGPSAGGGAFPRPHSTRSGARRRQLERMAERGETRLLPQGGRQEPEPTRSSARSKQTAEGSSAVGGHGTRQNPHPVRKRVATNG